MFLVLLLLLRGYPRSHGCLLSSIQYMLPCSSSLTKPAAIMYRYLSKSLSLQHLVFFSFTQFVRCYWKQKQSKAKQYSLDSLSKPTSVSP